MEYLLASLQQGATSGYDADTMTFMTATGIPDDGTVYYSGTPQEITGHGMWVAIDNGVKGLKLNGTWDTYQAIYPFIGGTAFTHKWNLKDPRDLDEAFRLSSTGTLTHSSGGVQSSGGYYNTFFNPITQDVGYSQAMSFYSRTNISENRWEMGAVQADDTDRSSLLKVRDNINQLRYEHFGDITSATNAFNDNSTGWFVGSRINNSDSRVYKDGVQLAFLGTTTTQIGPNNNYYLFGINFNDTPFNISTKQCAFASISSGLTDEEVEADYLVIQAFQTALNRNI